MFPVLAEIGSFRVHSYYLLWTLALSAAVLFTRRRITRLYGVDDEDARRIIAVSFLAMLAGARIGPIMEFWPMYAGQPARLLRFWEGGLSAVHAFLGAGIAGILMSRRKGIPLWVTADSAAIPAAVTVAIGRWGCFLNGCCGGTETAMPWGTVFPGDPAGLSRHPAQLYYAFGALFITAVLQKTERSFLSFGADRKIKGAVLWPLFMILYSILRLFADPFRAEYATPGLRMVRIILYAILAAGTLWLAHSLLDLKKKKC